MEEVDEQYDSETDDESTLDSNLSSKEAFDCASLITLASESEEENELCTKSDQALLINVFPEKGTNSIHDELMVQVNKCDASPEWKSELRNLVEEYIDVFGKVIMISPKRTSLSCM